MRQSLSLFGSLASAVLCAAAATAPFCSVAAQPPPAPSPVAADTAQTGPAQKERQLVFHWIKPSEFMAQLAPVARTDQQVVPVLLPVGLTSLSPDDTKNCLTIKGPPGAIKQVEQIMRLLDVKPRQVRLQMRILRAPITASVSANDELPEGKAVTTAEAIVRNNVPLNLNTVGDGQLFRVFVTPHINGDRSITLSAELAEVSAVRPNSVSLPKGLQAASENIRNARLWTRRIAGGKATVVASLPNEIDRSSAYYLEVTPVIASDLKP